MSVSVIAILTNTSPIEFVGRYVLQSGEDLTNTLLKEYKKRFDRKGGIEKFTEYLMKYHWFALINAPFVGYMISVSTSARTNPKRPVVIYLGEVARNIISGEDVEYVTERDLDAGYIDTLYLISFATNELMLYKLDELSGLWTKVESHLLQEISPDFSVEQELPQTSSPH